MIEAYLIHILILIGIYAILAMSLNIAMGFTGLLNIGHVAFYGIGAYTSALLAMKLGFPFWIAMITAGVFAAIAVIFVIPTLKLKGDYLALATLGFAVIAESVMRNWMSLTNGPMGLSGIPKPELFGFVFSSGFLYLILVAVIFLIVYVFLKHITEAPFGRVLKAVRDDELVAKSLGKDTQRYKIIALLISAFFAGIAGSLMAHYIVYIAPSSFMILESIFIVSIVIVGGLASLEGSIIGAVILTLLPELLRLLPLPAYAVGALRQMIYALILILLLILRPRGIAGENVTRQ